MGSAISVAQKLMKLLTKTPFFQFEVNVRDYFFRAINANRTG